MTRDEQDSVADWPDWEGRADLGRECPRCHGECPAAGCPECGGCEVIACARCGNPGLSRPDECTRRCGYAGWGRDLLEHERWEHITCTVCGRKPDGQDAVIHKPGCPRLQPGYVYPPGPGSR